MRLALVVPRYGTDMVGGAEIQARGFAEEGVRRGWRMEVWTSCAQSHYTWKNVYRPGQDQLNGVLIRRFPIDHWVPDERANLDTQLSTQGSLSPAEQYAWLAHGPHSTALYRHIAAQASEVDALIMLPYTAPLIHYAAWVAPQKTIIFPCLHNEPYAYMQLVHLLMENVWGVLFYAPEERDLAIETLRLRLRQQAVLGGGLEAISEKPDQANDLESVSENDLLFIGRLEAGKNLPLFYAYVRRYAETGGNIRLILLGRGPFIPPYYSMFDYRGFVSEADKARACATALALCQPSLNESFSIVIMEAWLRGRPVLVHKDCAVTKGHVQRSKGGLWFGTYEEFVAAFEWLQGHPQEAAQMGANGREYVRRNYTWPAVVDRFEKIMPAWRQA